jgi:exportin-1
VCVCVCVYESSSTYWWWWWWWLVLWFSACTYLSLYFFALQDMAVDTFLKISQKCRRKFVQVQPGESCAFIEELCRDLPSIISNLESHQVQGFHEAAGCMIAAHPDAVARELLTEQLLSLYNRMWRRLMTEAQESVEHLKNPDVLKEIQRVLRTNAAVCRSVGSSFVKQLASLYMDMLSLYKALSGFLMSIISTGGEVALQSTAAKAMRSVKKELLLLVSTYVSRSDDSRNVAEHFIPPLLEPVLGDYLMCPPSAKEAEVLNLMTEVISKLRSEISSEVPRILRSVFECTLQMITANFQDYPEHRLAFFQLIAAVNRHCFPSLFAIPPLHQKLVVDSVVWAFRHHDRDIGDTGLDILQLLLANVAAAGPEIAQPFYTAYFLTLVQDILVVMSDRLHKAHFKMHATILRHLFHLVEAGGISVPLWDCPAAVAVGAKTAYEAKLQSAALTNGGTVPAGLLTNQQFLREYIRAIIAQSFPNLLP